LISRLAALPSSKAGKDSTLECSPAELREASQLKYSSSLKDLAKCKVFIVTVPTPIDKYNRPDLTPLERSSETVGQVLKKGDVVVYESTVYPGCTEEVCIPIPGEGLGPEVQPGLLRGLQPGAHQSGRQGTPSADDPQGDFGFDTGSRGFRR
jgi:UDP-N-acetyl-D-galactosamine dehydrogenase